MSGALILRYVNPWKFRREQQERLRAIRLRDGDDCRRCRRPLRFDLPEGHDQGATIEQFLGGPGTAAEALDNFCLCHRRCNPERADNTQEVCDRVRRKNEAALFANTRKRAGRKG
jgi:hypothetical protein